MNIEHIMTSLAAKHPGESEYLQAVHEVLLSIEEVYNQHPEFEKAKLIERLVEPDRIITFKVPWVDDNGEIQVNLGYRVQFNNAIGPYKGGIRFHVSVNLSILKFLGFEQTFKTDARAHRNVYRKRSRIRRFPCSSRSNRLRRTLLRKTNAGNQRNRHRRKENRHQRIRQRSMGCGIKSYTTRSESSHHFGT